MKDQYVGDINDYLKYSVLRALGEAHTRSILVCWMLTVDDDRRDGLKTSYLRQPARYREIDSSLYDSLAALVAAGNRSTKAVERARILVGADFFREPLSDVLVEREEYLDRMWTAAEGRRIVFFDPDNGLDVPSVPNGRVGSRRYLYVTELERARDLELGLVVYQHIPRVQRPPYVARQLERLAGAVPGYATLAIYASHVAFLAAAPPEQAGSFEHAFRLAAQRWNGDLKVVVTSRPD